MRKFAQAIQQANGQAVIAEYKRASPSLGDINLTVTVEQAVQSYAANGATCLSILTEPIKFKGDIDFIQRAKTVTALPILRKDFIREAKQIEETKQAGADAILLIANLLTDQQLRDFIKQSHDLDLTTLLEVHDQAELDRALQLDSDLIGINSRNLTTLAIDLTIFDQLIEQIPDHVLAIAESGITNATELQHVRDLGFDGVLVGTYFMQRL